MGSMPRGGRSANGRPPLVTVAGTAAVAIAAQVALIHLLAFVQWHHFAAMVVSLAMLGYGLSGTLIASSGEALLKRMQRLVPVAVALVGVTLPLCAWLGQQVLFNPEELLWRPVSILKLAGVYLALSLPFLAAAMVTGLCLARWPLRAPALYAADLGGAALGGLSAFVALSWLSPTDAILAIGMAALALSLVALVDAGRGVSPLPVVLVVGAAAALILTPALRTVTLSPYKDLNQFLQHRGATVELERHHALGTFHVVDNPDAPLRWAPGLSLLATAVPPAQRAVFVDGDLLGGLTATPSGTTAGLAFLDQRITALPYHLATPRRVLLLDAGAGLPILEAIAHGARDVDAVLAHPVLRDALLGRYADDTGAIYARDTVRLLVAGSRAALADAGSDYDLIQLGPFGSPGASGLRAAGATWAYTVEAMEAMLDRLGPGGMLSISTWTRLPPRPTLRVGATMAEALRRQGHADPARHLVALRAWQMATLVARAEPWTDDDIARLRDFAEPRGFDLAWYPGMPETEANRRNRLPEPIVYRGLRALAGGEDEDFGRRYAFDVDPVTDDRPFGAHFLRWGTLGEAAELAGRGGLPLVEAGLVILLATLVQAVVAGALLLVIPMMAPAARHRGAGTGKPRARVLVYFTLIGLGFMLVEIAAIQAFAQYLAHPAWSAAAVLTVFLGCAGAGSLYAGRRVRHRNPGRVARVACLGVAAGVGGFLALAPALPALVMDLPVGLRLATVALLAPATFFMGQLFPLGLRALGAETPTLVPWAWGANGFASVAGAALAGVVAVTAGFTACLAAAVAAYVLAILAFPGGAVSVNPGSGRRAH